MTLNTYFISYTDDTVMEDFSLDQFVIASSADEAMDLWRVYILENYYDPVGTDDGDYEQKQKIMAFLPAVYLVPAAKRKGVVDWHTPGGANHLETRYHQIAKAAEILEIKR
jgi:hypothetical protein